MALAALDRCVTLGFSRFDAALGESQTLVHGTWRSADVMRRWLIGLPRRGELGRHLRGAAMSDGCAAPARLTWRRALPIIALTLAGFALTLRIFYPGVMTYDAWYVHADIAEGPGRRLAVAADDRAVGA